MKNPFEALFAKKPYDTSSSRLNNSEFQEQILFAKKMLSEGLTEDEFARFAKSLIHTFLKLKMQKYDSNNIKVAIENLQNGGNEPFASIGYNDETIHFTSKFFFDGNKTKTDENTLNLLIECVGHETKHFLQSIESNRYDHMLPSEKRSLPKSERDFIVSSLYHPIAYGQDVVAYLMSLTMPYIGAKLPNQETIQNIVYDRYYHLPVEVDARNSGTEFVNYILSSWAKSEYSNFTFNIKLAECKSAYKRKHNDSLADAEIITNYANQFDNFFNLSNNTIFDIAYNQENYALPAMNSDEFKSTKEIYKNCMSMLVEKKSIPEKVQLLKCATLFGLRYFGNTVIRSLATDPDFELHRDQIVSELLSTLAKSEIPQNQIANSDDERLTSNSYCLNFSYIVSAEKFNELLINLIRDKKFSFAYTAITNYPDFFKKLSASNPQCINALVSELLYHADLKNRKDFNNPTQAYDDNLFDLLSFVSTNVQPQILGGNFEHVMSQADNARRYLDHNNDSYASVYGKHQVYVSYSKIKQEIFSKLRSVFTAQDRLDVLNELKNFGSSRILADVSMYFMSLPEHSGKRDKNLIKMALDDFKRTLTSSEREGQSPGNGPSQSA